jgi:hypothetical protein
MQWSTRGNCSAAADIYQAFINELEAQSGKGVDAMAAAIMIADGRYLIVPIAPERHSLERRELS